MKTTLTLGLALVFLAFAACGDDDPGGNTTDNCTDADGDGYGVGTDCAGPDCNDANATCWLVGDACCAPADCTDADGDGYGVGTDCLGADCDDADAACWEGTCCGDCTDLDGDGYGDGTTCLGTDCDDSNSQCWAGACCPVWNCVDNDQDGYGNGTDCAGPDCNDNDGSCYTPGDACCPAPGNGNTGDACVDVTQCGGITNGTPECLTTIGGYINFPGGYCTGGTCTVGAACDTAGGICVDLMGQAQYCLATCTDANDCRAAEGYQCGTIPMSSDPATYCLPGMGP